MNDKYSLMNTELASFTIPHISSKGNRFYMSSDVDDLLALMSSQIAELKSARYAYVCEFPLNSDCEPDVGSIHQNIRSLKSQLNQHFDNI